MNRKIKLKKLDSVFSNILLQNTKIKKQITKTKKLTKFDLKSKLKTLHKNKENKNPKAKNISTPSSPSKSLQSSKTSMSGSGGFIFGQTNNYQNKSSQSKNGFIVNNQTIMIKTNYEMSGKFNKQGIRPTQKQVGSHAAASLDYIDNHGSKDLEEDIELSNTYDKYGDLISKEDFKEIKNDIKEVDSFRRTIVSLGQNDLDRNDLNKIIRESMQNFKSDTFKDFSYVYSIHTDTDNLHAHVLSYGSKSDINLTKSNLQNLKQEFADKTEEILLEKVIEQKLDKEITHTKDIEQTKDNSIELKQ